MQTAFGALTAVATFLLVQPRDAVKRKPTCCAGRTHAAPQQDAETVFRVQSSANTPSATATHIFPSSSPRKSLKPVYTHSKRQVARGKLHGLWTWIKDPTGFDDTTDKLKARRKAAKMGRARAVQSALLGADSPRIAAVHQSTFADPVDSSMVQLQCWVQLGVQGSAMGINMPGSAVLADVHARLREIDAWLAGQMDLVETSDQQVTLHHFSAPDGGYTEPVYDDHDVLDKWRPDYDLRSGKEAIDDVTLFAHLAAQKLADRALDSAIQGAVADVIQEELCQSLNNDERLTKDWLMVQAADALTLIA